MFTIFSFWWMNWRKGKLVVIGPRSFSAAINGKKITIYLPFVFYNSGAIPITIEHQILEITNKKDAGPIKFIAVVNKLGSSEGRCFATQFVVNGRESIKMICEFQGDVGDSEVQTQKYFIRLKGKLGHKRKWSKFIDFVLDFKNNKITSSFLTYDNFIELN